MNNEELYKRKLEEPEDDPDHFPLDNNGTTNPAASPMDPLDMKSEEELDGERASLHGIHNNPPAKRFRGTEELDIRFLISSREAGAVIGKGGININHLRKHYKSSVTVPDCPGPERVLSIVTSLDSLTDILNDIIGYIDDNKHQRGEAKPEVELRMLIHTSHAGGIIGRGGNRIRELRDQTGAAIKVFSQCCPMSTERICAIQGPKEVVVDAVRTVLDVILTTPIKGVVKLYDPFNFDIYTASDYGGFTEPGPSTGSYRGGGSGGHQGGGAHRSGGAGGGGGRNDMQSRGSWPPSVDSWSRMGSMPYDNQSDRRHPQDSDQMYQRWMTGDQGMGGPDSQGSMYWSNMMSGHGGEQMHSYQQHHAQHGGYGESGQEAMSLIENPDGSVTASLLVPNMVAGAIIGKGGNRIKTIRQDSGADVAIDSSSGQSSERQITIRGSRNQVRMAYNMLQNSISDNMHGGY